MPYTARKVGDKYVVYKKDTGKRVGATAGNKEALRKYLAALHINANESILQEELRQAIIKEVRKVMNETEAEPTKINPAAVTNALEDLIKKLGNHLEAEKQKQNEGILTISAIILSIPGLTPIIAEAIKTILKKSGINLKKKQSEASWIDMLVQTAAKLDTVLDAPFDVMLEPFIPDTQKRAKYASYFKALILTIMAILGGLDLAAFQRTAAYTKAAGWVGAKEAFTTFFTSKGTVLKMAKGVNKVLAAANLV